MSILSEIKNLFVHDKRILFVSHFKISEKMDDKRYIKKMYKAKTGNILDLENPILFSEKLQWLKIYNRNPLYTIMVDKIVAKEYVSKLLGEDCIIPTLGIWDNPNDIDFNSLPNSFVLKCNHNSGLGMVICKDKALLDIKKVKKELKKGIKENFYAHGREWPYKDVKRKIFAEEYMKNSDERELKDYKFYCFNGNPIFCQVICDRSTNETIDFYDMNWELQEFTGLEFPYKPHSSKVERPNCLEEMIEKAKILSKEIPFVRIDFYEIKGKVFFGEITFFPASGFGSFTPNVWNKKMGDLVSLRKYGDINGCDK